MAGKSSPLPLCLRSPKIFKKGMCGIFSHNGIGKMGDSVFLGNSFCLFRRRRTSFFRRGTLFFRRGTSFYRRENLILQEGKLISQEGNLISQEGNLILQEGNLISQKGNLISQEGNIVLQGWNLASQEGNLVSQEGKLVSQLTPLKLLSFSLWWKILLVTLKLVRYYLKWFRIWYIISSY